MVPLVERLRNRLSPASKLLCPEESGFDEVLKRWSDLDIEIPLAVVQPVNEEDIVLSVKEAIAAGIAITPTCGGHSTWSTVKNGLIIDLSHYKRVDVNADETVVVTGGVLMKDLQVALSREGRFTPVGNGSTVGVIPYFINGGISSYGPLTGYACDNIIKARLMTAAGDIVVASATTNSELFWGIRGAADGSRQLAMYFFTVDKAPAVCNAMKTIVNDTRHAHSGHFMAVNAPPDYKHQTLLVAPQFFGTAEELAQLCQPLIDIGPVQQMQMPSNFEQHSDHLNYLCAKGDFKRFSQIGLSSWDSKNILRIIELQAQLSHECPGAEKSGYSIEWHTPTQQTHIQELDTAFGMTKIQYWVNLLSWYHDPSQHDKVASFDSAAQEAARQGIKEKDFISYANCHRDVPLEHRYKGAERVSRLRKLKREWDPHGVFTRELL